MARWLDALERHDLGAPELLELARRFGENAQRLVAAYWGVDSTYYIHRGDLTLDDATAAIAELCKRSDHAPVLVVDGNLFVNGTLDAYLIRSPDTGNLRELGIAVTGDFRCGNLLLSSCALSVAGDLHVEGLFTSHAAHALVNIDGVTFARFEDAFDDSYDMRLAPSAVSMSLVRELERPEVDFIRCLERGESPFVVPIDEAVAQALAKTDVAARIRDIDQRAVERKLATVESGRSITSLTLDVAADALPPAVFELEHLEELHLPCGGVLSSQVRLLPKLRVLEGRGGLVLPTEIGLARGLEVLRVPASIVPASVRHLSKLRVLHARVELSAPDQLASLTSLEELRLHGEGELVPRLALPPRLRELHLIGVRTSSERLASVFEACKELRVLVLRLEVDDASLPEPFFELPHLESLVLEIPSLAPSVRAHVEHTFGAALAEGSRRDLSAPADPTFQIEARAQPPLEEPSCDELVRRADACVERADASAAIANLEHALRLAPDVLSVALSLAGLLLRRDRERAIELARAAVDDRREGDRAQAVLHFAELLHTQAEGTSRAERLYREGVDRFERLDFAGAAERWLDSMHTDRQFARDAARRSLLALFGWLGSSHPVTREFRRSIV